MRSLAFCLLFLVACTGTQQTARPILSVIPAQSTQFIVVISDDWNANQGQIYSFEKVDQRWLAQPITGPVMLGKSGLAWGIGLHPPQPGRQKAEGDGRAPAGLFQLTGAFGYQQTLDSAMPYQAMQADDYCIDINDSPLYNQTVDRRHYQAAWTAASTEPMRRDIHLKGDQAYSLGLFIDHNPIRRPGAGSCIFMHLWQSPTTATAGCTAMAAPQLTALLRWLDPMKHPLYLLLPVEQYQQLRQIWQLPELPIPE